MARHIAADGKELFRAVVTTTTTRKDGESFVRTAVYGPYNRTNEASALITREKNDAEQSNSRFGRAGWVTATRPDYPWSETEVTGHVEKAAVTWLLLGQADDVVQVPRAEFERLTGDSSFLETLFAHGLDSWDGYAAAHADHETANAS